MTPPIHITINNLIGHVIFIGEVDGKTKKELIEIVESTLTKTIEGSLKSYSNISDNP